MKKILFSVVICGCLLLGITGCGKNKSIEEIKNISFDGCPNKSSGELFEEYDWEKEDDLYIIKGDDGTYIEFVYNNKKDILTIETLKYNNISIGTEDEYPELFKTICEEKKVNINDLNNKKENEKEVKYRYFINNEEKDINLINLKNYKFDRYICTNDVTGTWDNEKSKFIIENDLKVNATCRLYFINN